MINIKWCYGLPALRPVDALPRIVQEHAARRSGDVLGAGLVERARGQPLRGRGRLDWGGSCGGSGSPRGLGDAVLTLSPPAATAVVSRKTSASRRRSKAAWQRQPAAASVAFREPPGGAVRSGRAAAAGPTRRRPASGTRGGCAYRPGGGESASSAPVHGAPAGAAAQDLEAGRAGRTGRPPVKMVTWVEVVRPVPRSRESSDAWETGPVGDSRRRRRRWCRAAVCRVSGVLHPPQVRECTGSLERWRGHTSG